MAIAAVKLDDNPLQAAEMYVSAPRRRTGPCRAPYREIDPIQAIEKDKGERKPADGEDRIIEQFRRQQNGAGLGLKGGALAALPRVDVNHREVQEVVDAGAHSVYPRRQRPASRQGLDRQQIGIKTPVEQSRRVNNKMREYIQIWVRRVAVGEPLLEIADDNVPLRRCNDLKAVWWIARELPAAVNVAGHDPG